MILLRRFRKGSEKLTKPYLIHEVRPDDLTIPKSEKGILLRSLGLLMATHSRFRGSNKTTYLLLQNEHKNNSHFQII